MAVVAVLVQGSENDLEHTKTLIRISPSNLSFSTGSRLFQLSVLLQLLVVCGTRDDVWGSDMLRTFSKHHWTLV